MSWRLAVDIGGTFTDLVAWNQADDSLLRAKVPTTPDDPVRGVVDAIDRTGLRLDDLTAFIHGSTIAINAVLQGTGARTALLTTKGFRDVLEMGRKSRPDMYNLFFRPRLCPVPRQHRKEVSERLDHTGAELQALNEAEVIDAVESLPADTEALAICFLHSHANPSHEQAAAELARRVRPELYISVSTDLSREFREYERTCTAVVNAYVGPLVGDYVGRLASHLTGHDSSAPLLLTQSNGGVMTSGVAVRQPVRTLESGPAAGVTGATWVGAGLDIRELIAFDMGGTSAKACVVEHGEPEVSAEYYVGGKLLGLPVQVPFLNIVEVGAGGGSIAHLDAAMGLKVGPKSAGSVPGPAAYGLGGSEATITDANLVVGKINPSYFNGGEMQLDSQLAREAISRLAVQLGYDVEQCALGIIRIANAIMAKAIRAVTVERGRDPRDFTLVAYGGAGPVHAAALAAELQIPRVLVPAGPGTFAAFGMLVTDLRYDVARTVFGRLDRLPPQDLEAVFRSLENEASEYVQQRFEASESTLKFVRKLDLRYVGQFHLLTLTLPDDPYGELHPRVSGLFHVAHQDRYGHSAPGEAIEVGALRVTAIGAVTKPPPEPRPSSRKPAGVAAGRRPVLFEDGAWHDCSVHAREDLAIGEAVSGPAIVEDPATSIVLAASDCATVLRGGHILITVGGGRT